MKKPTIVDLFAGAGGFSLGFKMSGFDVSLSLESDKWASETLKSNHPKSKVICDDIRNYDEPAKIKSVCSIKPDVVIGGPPCQGFSIAGPANKDPKDPRNSLFINFAYWVSVLEPKAFVMENVKGLLSRKNSDGESVIKIIRQAFEQLDYSVEVWVLNAANFGIPQLRERVFIVGRKDGGAICTPKATHCFTTKANGELFDKCQLKDTPTLWDAISDLPVLEAGEGKEEQSYQSEPQTEYQSQLRDWNKVLYNHVAMSHSPRLVNRFAEIKWGESSADVPREHAARRRNGNGEISDIVYDQNNRRLHPCKPSHTIAASFYANFVHPYQNRNLTAREGARVQSFPDWYKFLGKKTVVSHNLLQRENRLSEKYLCQYNQVGNAVPPLLAKVIADHLKETL